MLNWLSSSNAGSGWNPLKMSSKTSFPKIAPLAPKPSKLNQLTLGLLGKRQTWMQSMLRSIGTSGALALFLIPILALLAFTLFTKLVRGRWPKAPSLFSKGFHFPRANLPHVNIPHGKLPGLNLPHGHLHGSNLPHSNLLSGHLPKDHFLSGRFPKSRFGFLHLPTLPWYLRWLSPTAVAKKVLHTLVFRIFKLDRVPGLRHIVSWSMRPRGFIPKGTLATFTSLRSIRPGILSRLNPFNWPIFNRKEIAQREDDEKFQAGEPYGDPRTVSNGLVDDLRAVGFTAATKDLQTLIEVFKNKGKPENDREMAVSGWLHVA